MNRANLVGATAVLAGVMFGAAPVFAQHGHGGGHSGGHGSGHAGAGHVSAGAVHTATRVGGHAVPRASVPPLRAATRVVPHVDIHRPAYRPLLPALGVGLGYGLGHAHGYPFSGYGYRSYGYAYPTYGYAYPTSGYGYAYGGVRLDMPQRDAEVYVDGYYAGIVDDFDGSLQRLQLEPGPHRIEIRAPGYEPIALDVNIQPGRTIVYRQSLVPTRP